MSDMFERSLIERINDLKQRVADLTAQESIKRDSSGLPYFPALTTGSVLFAGPSGLLSQDNANLSWDDTNNILSINGVQFPVASGTFTPSFQGSATAGSWTYSIQAGFYTRIANRCFFNLTVAAATRTGVPSGDAWIVGLPINSNPTANSHSPVSLDTILGFTLSGTIVQLTGRVPVAGTRIELIENTGTAPSSASTLAATGITATAFIRASGSYII